MKKSLITLVVFALVASLAIPVMAAAKGGPQGRGNSGAAQERKAEHVAAKLERSQARTAAKLERTVQKQQLQAQRRAVRGLEAEDADEADETSPSVEASPSVDTTKAVGPGVENALARITRNIERKLAKVGFDGKLPPGLMRVWLKFSTWLGHDTTVTPWTPPASTDTSDTAPPSGDTSPTPPPGEDTSPSVDPSAPVVPVAP